MKRQKRADELKQGDHVLFHEQHLAIVVCNWDQGERPFRSIAFRNYETQLVSEMSVPCSLVFEVVELT